MKITTLTEKIAEVDEDVEFIYNRFFKELYDKIRKTGKIDQNLIKYKRISSKLLKSPLAKKAHKVNPIDIEVFSPSGSNAYSPQNRTITLGQRPDNYGSAFWAATVFGGGDINVAAEKLPVNQRATFFREFKPETIKASIHHELAHWIDDSLHNDHIRKELSMDNIIGNRRGHEFNAGHIERHGQIHNIYQLKKALGGEHWDELTFDEMINYSPSLKTIARKLSPTLRKTWKKALLKRMAREKLLGKKMRYS